MKLDVKAFGITCGLMWGLGLFFLTWWVIAFDGSGGDAGLLGQIYRGFAITPLGSVIGMIWGFFDALIGGIIFAWLYNLLSARMRTAS